jgi:transcriptional regulator with XRE-family HTH domain
MSAINHEIGERLRGIRELNELTVDELARRVNTPAEKLSLYETGEADIPLSILHDISNELKISMTELITGEKAKLSLYSVTRKGKGKGVERGNAYDYKSLAHNFSHRKMEPFVITIEAAPEEEPFSLNAHNGQEFHLCLEGSFLIKIGSHIITINEGDSIYFDSKHPHGMKALGERNAKDLVVLI